MTYSADVKYLKDMTVDDVAVDPSFDFGKELSDRAIRDAFSLLHVFYDEFPRFQTASFPDGMIGDLLVNEVEPKLRPLVTEGYWSGESQRFISGNGSSMIAVGVFSDGPTPKTWQLSGGNSCTATDEPFDIRHSDAKLSLEKDPATNGDLAVFSAVGTYIIQCAEGKPLHVKMDTTIKSQPMGDKWLANDATRSAAYDVKILTPLR